MKGYTHTCASCESRLPIHDRYVGRTLHCPHCGTEFLADPTLADIDDIIDELAPARERSVPWLWIMMIVVVLGVAALWLGQADEDGLLSELFRPSRAAGQFSTLAIEGRTTIPAAMDHETIVFAVNALEDNDPGSLDALRAQGRLIDITDGTQVKVIEIVRRDRSARVRVLAGPWTGRVIWVPRVALR
jgi:hypothetical protein